MRFTSLFLGALLAALALFSPAGTAHAQTWKKICVGGGATSGAHNGTWQRVNTNGSGGGTWKKAGGCTPPPPPQPTGPPATVFNGLTMVNNIMGYSRDWQTGMGVAQLVIAADGSWSATGGLNLQTNYGFGPASGRYRATGYAGDQFEVRWVLIQAQTGTGADATWQLPYFTTSTSAQGAWASLGTDWQIRLADKSGDCYWAYPDYLVTIDLSIRSKQDPAISRTDRIQLSVHGYDGHFCSG